MEYSFTVGALQNLVAESSTQFKPVLGKNVENDNKKNNDKSYKEISKETSDYNPKPSNTKRNIEKVDYNRTTLDYNPVNEPSKEYKDRIEAQAEGYTSTLEKNNKIDKAADFEGAKEIYKAITKSAEEHNKNKEDMAHSGLQARELDKPKLNTLHEETIKPRAKRLTFKHTKFLNESQVLTRIPDQYKVDGQVIHMCDNEGSEYIVECVLNRFTGNIETNVISCRNKQKIDEQLSRIKELMNYKSTSSRDVRADQIEENKNFSTLMENCRKY